MRLCFFYAISAGAEPSTIFEVLPVDVRPEFSAKQGDVQHMTVGGVEFITRLVMGDVAPAKAQTVESSTFSGAWDIYQAIPFLDDDVAPGMLMRSVARARQGDSNKMGSKLHLLGPWTAKQFDQLDWVADKLCYEQEPDSFDEDGFPSATTHKKSGASLRLPWVIAGDDPVELAAVDYDGANQPNAMISDLKIYNRPGVTS